MIELRITGETPQDFLQNVIVAHAALAFRGAVATAKPAEPAVATGDSEKTTQKSLDPALEEPVKPAPARARGRPAAVKKEEPAEALIAEPVPEAPKDLEGMRAYLQSVIATVGTDKVSALIASFGAKLSAVPLDKYPDMARAARKLLDGAAA
jgi:hypothetical protein